ncbi:hypothetical protein [Clostridium sp. CF012]|nr:hypothetical protein [Clostridium sp. CF012]MBU3146875.1 hypothetical protein [Clostridium sp. CF012]
MKFYYTIKLFLLDVTNNTGATSVKALSTVATQVGTSDVFELNFVQIN